MVSSHTPSLELSSFEEPVTALVVGASRGIGLAFVRALAASTRVRRIWGGCRRPAAADELAELASGHERIRVLPVDITDESVLAAAAAEIGEDGTPLNLVINCAGLLHADDGMAPERRLREVRGDWLARAFSVNATGPILLAKHVEPLLPRRKRAVFASLSARVGSIGDNRLGGWYAYRASKAAQNMLLKTLSVELPRRARGAIVVALHPGTTDTDLSRPFQGSVPADKLFPPERAAGQLLQVIDGLRAGDNGTFYAWDGRQVPW
jgi:NAD(P)-dependent dehydrogenase (short-subunit alcohol dehydrogenase family)